MALTPQMFGAFDELRFKAKSTIAAVFCDTLRVLNGISDNTEWISKMDASIVANTDIILNINNINKI